MPCRSVCWGVAVVLAWADVALAVENTELTEGEVLTVTAPSLEDVSPSSVTVLDLQQDYGRGEQLADVLARAPGVAVRRTGALGSFTSISIRGLGGRNVALVLDDQPLTNVTLGPIDVALLPLESIDRAEVYRGAAPARYSGPLAGVLRLRTQDPGDTLKVNALGGYGSFQTRTLSASLSGPVVGDLGVAAGVVYQGTRGDFTYYDDRETLYTTADDRRVRRTNNDSNSGAARLKLVYPGPANGRLVLSVNGFMREQGIAGSGARQTTEARARDTEVLSRFGLESAMLGRLVLGAAVDVLVAERTFKDPLDEVGLAVADSTAKLLTGAVDTRAAMLWSATHVTELAPRLSVERFQQTGFERSASFAARAIDRTRLLLGSGLEHRAIFGDWTLVPSARLDVEHNEGTTVSGIGNVAEVSPRLGVLYAHELCTARANVGRYHRLPTTSERFGDGITTIASPNLQSEQGVSADLGGRCRLAGASFELTGFGTRASRLIALVQNSQLTGIATNLGATHIAGVEAAAQLQRTWFALDASYTLTSSRDASDASTNGNRTPGIPLHDAHGRASVGPAWASLRYDIDVRSSVFLDAGNLRPLPTRIIHDLGAESFIASLGLTLAVTVRNLTDRIVEDVRVTGASGRVPSKVSDYIGYPLPGRSVFVSMKWSGP